MVLELHIWGPAFSLPSIDAQCLATIAYCALAVPKGEWVLIASSDPSVCPTNELPALRNGSTWVSRFRNIVDYLRQYSNGEWDLDADMSSAERADNIAFSSFIEARGHPLIDLSLYVSSQNYWTCTSPAYARILKWPNQWIIPPRLHAAAKHRTEHLGLSSLDLDALQEQRERDHSAAVAAGQIPKNMRFLQRPRETVVGLLGKTAPTNRFRLDALTAEFFEPLEALLVDGSGSSRGSPQKRNTSGNGTANGYLLSDDRPRSVDCLALAYLSLALVSGNEDRDSHDNYNNYNYNNNLPYPWLADAMKSKAPTLVEYISRMRRVCFGPDPVQVEHAFSSTTTTSGSGNRTRNSTIHAVPRSIPSPGLPWHPPERISLARIGNTLLSTMADSIPILKEVRMNNRLRAATTRGKEDDGDEDDGGGFSKEERTSLKKFAESSNKDIYLSVAMVVGGVLAMAGYMVHVGLIAVISDENKNEEEGDGEEQGGEKDKGAGVFDAGQAGDFLGFGVHEHGHGHE